MASRPVARKSHSTRQAVSHDRAVGAGGAGEPVRASAGLGSGSVSGTGGWLRASAVATPKASPMTSVSTTARRAKSRPRTRDGAAVSPAPPESYAVTASIRSIVTRRCHAPATPRAANATTLTRTRTPYGVTRSDHVAIRVLADMTPEMPRATKHQRATVE